MTRETSQTAGLTRVIVETLYSLHTELLEEGQDLNSELLDVVGSQVRACLCPGPNKAREQIIFEMVFQRAFGEARDIYLAAPHAKGLKAETEPISSFAAVAG